MFKDIEKLVRLIQESEFDEFEWEKNKERIRLKKTPSISPGMVASYSAPSIYAHTAAPPPMSDATRTNSNGSANTEMDKPAAKQVLSPFVGTYYEAPAPDAPKYVDIGKTFKKGDVLCIVEAMKIMNEIEAEFSGKILNILVKNGQAVQYGQPLFEVDTL